MSYIKKIIKKLQANANISDYSITEVETKTSELFFDIHKLETVRTTNTLEDSVTIYTTKVCDGKKFLGSATFNVTHLMSGKELEELIENSLYAASFAKNEFYEIPTGGRKKVTNKEVSLNPFEDLKLIANEFLGIEDSEVKFNSLELFYNIKNIHLVNSRGVDYQTSKSNINVEAIPSFSGNGIKTELYYMFDYKGVDLNKVKEDVLDAVLAVKNRANATKLSAPCKMNVILKEQEVEQLFSELVENLEFSSVYFHQAPKNVGEALQVNPTFPLNITVTNGGKADFFDGDGTIIKNVDVIKDGIVANNYGSNRYAYYLGKEATGIPSKIVAKAGKKSIDAFKKKPYLEIIALSGIQIDVNAGYIGGEIRLANYFDGKTITPLTGLSFSGNLNECINTLEASKEVSDIKRYKGPKYVVLKDMELM